LHGDNIPFRHQECKKGVLGPPLLVGNN